MARSASLFSMSASDTTPMTHPPFIDNGKGADLCDSRISVIIFLNEVVFLTATTGVVITSLAQLFIVDHLLAKPHPLAAADRPPQVNGACSPALWPPHQGPTSLCSTHSPGAQWKKYGDELGISEVHNEARSMGGTGRCRFPGIARRQE